MRPADLFLLVWGSLRLHKLRTRMTYAAIAIGIGSVLLLTALGEGARAWVVDQFSSMGSNVLIALPGRTETRGGIPMIPTTTRDLTLDDMHALEQRLPGLQLAVPLSVGEAPVSHEGRVRATTIIGSTRGFLRIRKVTMERGTELPELDPRDDQRICIIGRTVARELFPQASPVGARIRVGGYPFRVLGVIASEGQSMMTNMDEVVLVPVAAALHVFNRAGLFRLLVQISAHADVEVTRGRMEAILKARHDGEEDFTVLTPGAIAQSLGVIIGIITTALAGIAGISLAVAGIGVMNVMVVTVVERTPEIGLMKALGASNLQVLEIFLAEAFALSAMGGAFGLAGGWGLTRLGSLLYPAIPFRIPGWSIASALGVAAVVGLVFGILPASRAARLDPLDSLRKKA